MGVLGTMPNEAKIALNFVRTADPTQSDDIADGYGVGSYWTNQLTGDTFICLSNNLGKGNWATVIPPPPTRGGGLRTWRPPDLASGFAGYQQRTMSNSGTQPNGGRNHSVTPGSGVNAVFNIAEILTGQCSINGFNNVVLIGGDINTGVATAGLTIDKCTGIVHIEGLRIRGSSVVDCFALRTGHVPPTPGATVQVQNCNFQNSNDDAGHADAIQIWGPFDSTWLGGCHHLRVDRCTLRSMRQCIFLGNHGSGQVFLSADIRNTNVAPSPNAPAGWTYIIAKPLRRDISNILPNSTISFTNVYATGNRHPSGWHGNFMPGINGDDGGVSVANEPGRASQLGVDAQGEYVYWLPTSDASGEIRIGSPPGGDFAPVTTVGVNYVSPGYQ